MSAIKTPIICFFCLAVLAACVSETSSEKAVSAYPQDAQATKTEGDETSGSEAPTALESDENTPSWPILDDTNCEAFLLAYGAEQGSSMIVMETKYGEIWVELFEDTPLHRANFLYIIERDYYSPTQIVRVVPDFVVQGGNSEEEADQEKRFFIGEYSLPAEFRGNRIHTSGALAMSRNYTDNPNKRSSAYDFYIVAGSKLNQATLYASELENSFTYSEAQKASYLKKGGSPHLDGEHTVFGQVVKGMDAVIALSRVDRDESDWPRETIMVDMRIVN